MPHIADFTQNIAILTCSICLIFSSLQIIRYFYTIYKALIPYKIAV